MAEVNVSLVAVLLAAIADTVLGAIWYSPKVFGAMWMRLTGLNSESMKSMKMTPTMAIAGRFVAVLVLAHVLAHFATYTAANTATAGFQLGFWIWLGFVATLSTASFLFEGKSFKLWLLNNAYNLISLLAMGAIIAAWS